MERSAFEQFGGPDKAMSVATAESLASFWSAENLKKIFEEEGERIAASYKKLRAIENGYEASKSILEFARKLPKDRKAMEAELDAKRIASMRDLWDAKGLFLQKLWSAVDFLLEKRRLEIERVGGQSYSMKRETISILDDFFPKVFNGLKPAEGDSKALSPTLDAKVKLAEDLRRFGEAVGSHPADFLPEAIDGYAAENEKRALGELQKLKKEIPPAEARRNEKIFNPDLDISKIPSGSAVPTLHDYKRHLEKIKNSLK